MPPHVNQLPFTDGLNTEFKEAEFNAEPTAIADSNMFGATDTKNESKPTDARNNDFRNEGTGVLKRRDFLRAVGTASLALTVPSGLAQAVTSNEKSSSRQDAMHPKSVQQKIDNYIETWMKRRHIPGLSIAAAKDGEIVLAKGYGLASIEFNAPAAEDTVYHPFFAQITRNQKKENRDKSCILSELKTYRKVGCDVYPFVWFDGFFRYQPPGSTGGDGLLAPAPRLVPAVAGRVGLDDANPSACAFGQAAGCLGEHFGGVRTAGRDQHETASGSGAGPGLGPGMFC